MKKTSENSELFWRQTTGALGARSAEKASTSGKNILTADTKEENLGGRHVAKLVPAN